MKKLIGRSPRAHSQKLFALPPKIISKVSSNIPKLLLSSRSKTGEARVQFQEVDQVSGTLFPGELEVVSAMRLFCGCKLVLAFPELSEFIRLTTMLE
jgi:hypothetical protein